MLFVYGVFVGAFIGILIMSLVVASRDFDRDSDLTEMPEANVEPSDDAIEALSEVKALNKDNK